VYLSLRSRGRWQSCKLPRTLSCAKAAAAVDGSDVSAIKV
jgi:hypothetical protein